MSTIPSNTFLGRFTFTQTHCTFILHYIGSSTASKISLRTYKRSKFWLKNISIRIKTITYNVYIMLLLFISHNQYRDTNHSQQKDCHAQLQKLRILDSYFLKEHFLLLLLRCIENHQWTIDFNHPVLL